MFVYILTLVTIFPFFCSCSIYSKSINEWVSCKDTGDSERSHKVLPVFIIIEKYSSNYASAKCQLMIFVYCLICVSGHVTQMLKTGETMKNMVFSYCVFGEISNCHFYWHIFVTKWKEFYFYVRKENSFG